MCTSFDYACNFNTFTGLKTENLAMKIENMKILNL